MIGDGVKFLVNSVRPDGSWPIDTNLATWNTTLAINALAGCFVRVNENELFDNSTGFAGVAAALQSGGNNVLWGFFRNGQVPGPEAFQQGGPMTPPGYQQGPNGFNYFGAATPDNVAIPR